MKRRTAALVAATLAAFLVAAPAGATDPAPRGTTAATSVTSVSIVPATGKAEVVIGDDGLARAIRFIR